MRLPVSLLTVLWLTLGVGQAQVLSHPGGKGSVVTVTNHIGTVVENTYNEYPYKQWRDAKDDFGAKGDGVADDTAALQTALDTTAAAHDVLYIPTGVYKITKSLVLTQRANFGVRGPTKQGSSTTIKWAGAKGGTMLLLDGVRESEWSDLAFDGVSADIEPAVIVDIDKIAAGATISRKNGFHRMLLRGGSTSTVRIANTSTTNNEAHVFEDVNVASIGALGETRYGYQVKNINAKNIQIIRGEIGGKTSAVMIQEGSIHLHSVEISGSHTWVTKAAGGEPTVIENCDGDSSARFLHLMQSNTSPVYATGNRFIQHGEGDLFTFHNNTGPVVLISNDFASGVNRPGATTTIVSNGPRMVAIGNVFPNNTILPYPFAVEPTHFAGLYALGNQFYGTGNQLWPLDDVLVPNRTSGGDYSSLRFGGASGWLAEDVPIATPADQIQARSGTVVLIASAAYTLTSTPTILPGQFTGQMVKLLNFGNNAVTLQDRGTLEGSGIALTAETLTIGPRQSVSFTWSATLSLWIQTGPLVVPL